MTSGYLSEVLYHFFPDFEVFTSIVKRGLLCSQGNKRKLDRFAVTLKAYGAAIMALCWPATPSEVRFALDSMLEGDGFEPSVPREGPTRRDGFIRLSSGGSEAHHRRSAISTARSGRRSPPGP